MADFGRGHGNFSLVELLILVVIIIALAIVAIPQFMKEAGRHNKKVARETLQAIYRLEREYFQTHGTYLAAGNTQELVASGLGLRDPGSNSPYEYLVRNVTDSTFTAIAREKDDADGDGTFGEYLSIDQDVVRGGDWE